MIWNFDNDEGLDGLIRLCSKAWNIKSNVLTGRCRHGNIAKAREILLVIACLEMKISAIKISESVSVSDKTIKHHVSKHADKMDSEYGYKDYIENYLYIKGLAEEAGLIAKEKKEIL